MIDQNIAEQSVIGCILMDGSKVMPEAAGQLTPEDFSLPDCKTIFTACKKLFLSGKPVDTITVLHELGGEDEGYREHLLRLAEAAPTLSHFREYVGIVAENAKRLKAMEGAASLMGLLEAGIPLAECQDAAARIVQDMTVAKGNCVTAADGFALVAESLDKPRQYIASGFGNLDRYILFDRGDYLVIGGRPSAGKTAFSLQMVLNMAKRYNVCYFSLETSTRKIYERLLSCFTDTPFDEINRGRVQNKGKLLNERERFSALRLHVIDAAGWTVQQVKAKAVQLQADVVMIDYIGLLKGPGKSLYERVTGVSQDLHIMAQQGKIAVVALSQLNRGGKDEPDMTSLRESGQIEQDADAILLLNTVGDEKGRAGERDLIIAKNKTGRTGKMRLVFNGNFQRFTELCERGESECRPF
ncbi:replicative DNA helicase [Anaerotruncus rubiinfantis]|uniref:replicative DNA helicase n=3 Tax=Anaerotruncus rubiinfantis TaxID=1720200 RepID=UPI001896BF63|nr:DnaB-like helicase C-terminal domain-containing protein [Anaerotruncus rubiinfantis]